MVPLFLPYHGGVGLNPKARTWSRSHTQLYLFQGQRWKRCGIREGVLCGLVAGWVAREAVARKSTSLPTRIYQKSKRL